jgi:WD40 repeat protein
MDVLSVCGKVLGTLNRLAETYDDVGRKASSLSGSLVLVTEFVKLRIGSSNPLDSQLSHDITGMLIRLDETLRKIERKRSTVLSRACFFASGVLGLSTIGMNKALRDLQDIECDMNDKLNILKMDMMSNNNAILSMMAGVHYDNPDSPKIFWYRSFRDKEWVSTEQFAEALMRTHGCAREVSQYMSSTLSEQGVVHLERFLSAVPPDGDVTSWVRNDHPNTLARTVHIPGHVGRITSIATVGNMLITASVDCTLKVFDQGDTLVLKHVMIGHEQRINDFCTFDGVSALVSVSDDSTLRVWNLETGEQRTRVILKDVPHRVRCVDGETVLYLNLDTVFPFVLVNACTGRVVRRYRFDKRAPLGIDVSSTTVFVNTPDGIYTLSLETGEWIHHVDVPQHSTSIMFLASHETQQIVCGTKTGICVYDRTSSRWKATDICSAARVSKIYQARISGDVMYVLWVDGTEAKVNHLAVVSLATGACSSSSVISCMYSNHCVDFVVGLTHTYFATNKGNIVWYKNSANAHLFVGHTINDQVTCCQDAKHVCMATCDRGVVICNDRELRVWNETTNTVSERVMDCDAKCCVYCCDEIVVAESSSALCFYDTSLNVLRRSRLPWIVDNMSVVNNKLVIMKPMSGRFSEDTRHQIQSKELYVFDTKLRRVDHLSVFGVLFSTSELVFLSTIDGLSVCSADTLEVKRHIRYDVDGDVAVSGCECEGRYYTLHRSRVNVWTAEFELEQKVAVNESVSDIRNFKSHIIGLSTVGSVFVYDKDMVFTKCIVTHGGSKIYGTSHQDTEVVVSDKRGVFNVLKRLADSAT